MVVAYKVQVDRFSLQRKIFPITITFLFLFSASDSRDPPGRPEVPLMKTPQQHSSKQQVSNPRTSLKLPWFSLEPHVPLLSLISIGR